MMESPGENVPCPGPHPSQDMPGSGNPCPDARSVTPRSLPEPPGTTPEAFRHQSHRTVRPRNQLAPQSSHRSTNRSPCMLLPSASGAPVTCAAERRERKSKEDRDQRGGTWHSLTRASRCTAPITITSTAQPAPRALPQRRAPPSSCASPPCPFLPCPVTRFPPRHPNAPRSPDSPKPLALPGPPHAPVPCSQPRSPPVSRRPASSSQHMLFTLHHSV